MLERSPMATVETLRAILGGEAPEPRIADAVRMAAPATKVVPGSATLLRSALDSAGRWLAARAQAEEASIATFARLARELEGHGAPAALVTRARDAARDEARHALVMRRLARRAGMTTMPDVARPDASSSLRTLEAIAFENATHGCVRKTYAALLAAWQATSAEDPEVRA